MRPFSGFICSKQSRCGGLRSKCIWQLPLDFITLRSNYVQLNRQGPASIFYIVRAPCWCQMHSDVAPERVHPPFKCHSEFCKPSFSNTPEIGFQWCVARCQRPSRICAYLSQSKVWEHWFHNFFSKRPHVMIHLCWLFYSKNRNHFHISA